MKSAVNMLRLTPELEEIRFAARRYCDEQGIEDLSALEQVIGAMTQQAFLRNIEPYTKAMADAAAFGIGTILQHADGTVEHIPQPLPPDLQKNFDELIEMERKRFGLSA